MEEYKFHFHLESEQEDRGRDLAMDCYFLEVQLAVDDSFFDKHDSLFS